METASCLTTVYCIIYCLSPTFMICIVTSVICQGFVNTGVSVALYFVPLPYSFDSFQLSNKTRFLVEWISVLFSSFLFFSVIIFFLFFFFSSSSPSSSSSSSKSPCFFYSSIWILVYACQIPLKFWLKLNWIYGLILGEICFL